jgi:peptidoglycan/xylan/chitin deacetylase (PgdA/CDA1 family)
MRLERRQVREVASALVRQHPRSAGLARFLSPRACVLTYHRVATPERDPHGQAVSPDNFARQLAWLRERYRVVALTELLANVFDGTVVEGTVAVTFDDGYADTLSAAVPIAASTRVPLHVFVTVGPVLHEGSFWWDDLTRASGDDGTELRVHAELKRLPAEERARRLEQLAAAGADPRESGRPLTRDELDRLAAMPRVSIGSHTLSHPCLAALGRDDQLHELTASRQALEEHLQRPVTTVSYPFGKDADLGAETPELARAAGYEAAFTSTGRPVTPASVPLALSRVTVHDWGAAMFRDRLRAAFGY